MNNEMQEAAEVVMYKNHATMTNLQYDMFMEGWEACLEYLEIKDY